jgi:hypothetical protein
MHRAGALVLVCMLSLLLAGSAQPITFGEFDGNLHPNVGTLLADWNEESPGPDSLCSGTLIASETATHPAVFLTAAHCTAFLESEGITDVWVTFDPVYDEESATPDNTLIAGIYVTNEQFGTGGQNNPHDIAVVLLESDPGVAPAELPEIGLLDGLNASHLLSDQIFTAVGYGLVRETKTGGLNTLLDNSQRRFALQQFLSLQKAWLLLSMNPSTGSGGACYGDSGGPHFLGDETSNLIVSITITGDVPCRATDKSYRLDTQEVHDFLAQFGVPLPE